MNRMLSIGTLSILLAAGSSGALFAVNDRAALLVSGYANQTALIAKDADKAALLLKKALASEKAV